MNKAIISLFMLAGMLLMWSCSEDERSSATMPQYSDVEFSVGDKVVSYRSVPVGEKVTVTLVTSKKASNVYRYDYTWTCRGVSDLTPTSAILTSADATNSFTATEPGDYTMTITVKCYNGADGDVKEAKTVQLPSGCTITYSPGVLYSNITVSKPFTVK